MSGKRVSPVYPTWRTARPTTALLAGASRVRGTGRQAGTHRHGNPLPAHPPELPPLRLVPGGPLHRAADLDAILAFRFKDGFGSGWAPSSCGSTWCSRRLHLLLPLLPARLRRCGGRLLQGAGALLAVARITRLNESIRSSPGCPCQRGADRPLHPPRLHGDHPRLRII